MVGPRYGDSTVCSSMGKWQVDTLKRDLPLRHCHCHKRGSMTCGNEDPHSLFPCVCRSRVYFLMMSCRRCSMYCTVRMTTALDIGLRSSLLTHAARRGPHVYIADESLTTAILTVRVSCAKVPHGLTVEDQNWKCRAIAIKVSEDRNPQSRWAMSRGRRSTVEGHGEVSLKVHSCSWGLISNGPTGQAVKAGLCVCTASWPCLSGKTPEA